MPPTNPWSSDMSKEVGFKSESTEMESFDFHCLRYFRPKSRLPGNTLTALTSIQIQAHWTPGQKQQMTERSRPCPQCNLKQFHIVCNGHTP